MSKIKLSVCVSIIIMAFFNLSIIAPSLVSEKSTYSVFIGFLLTAMSIFGLVYSFTSFLRGK